jgi:hypothetical protein
LIPSTDTAADTGAFAPTPYRAALPKEIFVAINAEDDIAIIVDFIVDADGHIERISSGRQDVNMLEGA